jgi:hypothetical protein
MIAKAREEGLRLNLMAQTLEDRVIIEKLLWVNQIGDWKDLLVYLQKKYENV